MATKNNIRSIRFSDEMMEMIESQSGETFTAKFEALVTHCMWELPEKEKELAAVQKQIDNEKKRLQRLRERASQWEQKISNISYALDQCNRQAEYAINQIKAFGKDA